MENISMGDTWRLAYIWRGHLRAAEEKYSAATRHASEVQADYKAKDLPPADGNYALQQALRSENDARATYMAVLEIYTHVLVHGELPENLSAKPVLSDKWDSVWSELSDETLEQRLSHYYWLATLAPNIYLPRLAVLIAEAERRGKPEIVDRVKAWVTKYGRSPATR